MALPGAWPIKVVSEVCGYGRQTGYRLGGEFYLEGEVADTVRHWRAGDEFAHAPLFDLELSEAAASLGLNIFDIDGVFWERPLGQGLRPLSRTGDDCETHFTPAFSDCVVPFGHLRSMCHHSVT